MQRRHILKAAGATSALALAGGVSAQEDGDEEGEQQGRQDDGSPPNSIHPTLGYTGLSNDSEPPAGIEPDHEVDLLTVPSEDRPLPEALFQPTGLHVEEGDVVRFDFTTPGHSVTAYHPLLGRQRRVPQGVSPFSSPVLSDEAYWLYRFDQAGVYDVFCAPHELVGMVMRVVVGDASTDFGPAGGEQYRSPALTAASVLDDPALSPDEIRSEGTVSWDDLADESKELPVSLPAGAAEDD